MKFKRGLTFFLALILAFTPVMVSAAELEPDDGSQQNKYWLYTVSFKEKLPAKTEAEVGSAVELSVKLDTAPTTISNPDAYIGKLKSNQFISQTNPARFHCHWGYFKNGVLDINHITDEGYNKFSTKLTLSAQDVGEHTFGLFFESQEPVPNGGFVEMDSSTTLIVKEAVAINSVTVTPDSAKLKVGETKEFKAEVKPSGADQGVTWSSSNTKVATVDAEGKVTAVGAGDAVITATSVKDKTKSGTAKITVEEEQKDTSLKSIKITGSSKVMKPTKTKQLKIEYTPADTKDIGVTWKSSNKKVAKVDKNGKVTAVAAGSATITATSTKNNKIKATFKIKVAGMKLNANKFTMKANTTNSKIKIKFTNDSFKSATVTSDKDKVIKSVTPSVGDKDTYLAIRAKRNKKGKATITVTSEVGLKAKITVNVQKGEVTTEKISILNSKGQAKTKFSVKKNKKLTLTIKAKPDQFSTGEKATISKNTRKSVAKASINTKGQLVIKGKKKGETKITVRVGKVTKRITVTVK